MNVWQEYEIEKEKIYEMDIPQKEKEKLIKELIDRLEI